MSEMYKNRYKIDEEKFTELTRMSEGEMGKAMESYYVNWQTSVDNKKKDGEIERLVEKKNQLTKEIQKDPEIVELKAKLEQKVFEKTSEEKARIDEELKNARSEYNADIKQFRAFFYTCADLKTKRFLGK